MELSSTPTCRKYNLSRRAEEYLELIHIMLKNGEKPRIREIARRLGVKPSSVVEYLRRLESKGYIVYEKGGNIYLTEKGLKYAESIYERHKILTRFLELLGVPHDIAEEDACYIEHGIHDITLEKIIRFIKKCGNFLNEINRK